eukprot:3216614-Alexandrium_andersonii.AAC.1
MGCNTAPGGGRNTRYDAGFLIRCLLAARNLRRQKKLSTVVRDSLVPLMPPGLQDLARECLET